MLVAFAAAIALHEIVAGFIPDPFTHKQDEPETVQHVTIARIVRTPTPKPSPTPSPTPPPKTPPPQVTHKVAVVAPIATPVPAPVGKSATAEPIKRIAAARPKTPHIQTSAKPTLYVPTGGQGAGAGNASGAGSVGTGQAGTGTGDQGTGAGGGGAPCGAVDFEARGRASFNAATGMYERSNIVATVHFSDGHSENVPLDWTWHFKSQDLDPFANSATPMFFQFPPRDQRASEPDLVQYIMRYSSAGGSTKLKDDCPNIPPPVTPHP